MELRTGKEIRLTRTEWSKRKFLFHLFKPIFKNSFRLWRDSISVNGTDSMNSKRDSGMKFTIWPNSDLTGFPTSLESAPSPLLFSHPAVPYTFS